MYGIVYLYIYVYLFIKNILLYREKIQRSRPISISLTAGCQLFERHVTRTSLECDFDDCKKKLIERGEGFAALSLAAE